MHFVCNLKHETGDVSFATVGTPVPPPVKNDWLSSALDNPKLSPPSPGGPRKGVPMTTVSSLVHFHTEIDKNG